MPDITETQVREFIALKLADDSDITAVEHREVENKIMDFLVQEIAKTAKSKILLLESFAVEGNYSIATGLPVGAVIDSVVAMLVCKVANNGFQVNDTVTATTPYPLDAGRTPAQGIGVQYNNISNDVIKVMVNDQLTIMTAYDPAVGADVDNVRISGTDAAKWSIKLIVGYK